MQTFDASLIDTQQSFSSTETNTSGLSAKENTPPSAFGQPGESSPCRRVPTDVLYAQWASTYDTDGNVLQCADDIQLARLLPRFVEMTKYIQHPKTDRCSALSILDLGCGTGRNTVKLLQADWNRAVHVVGWDSSQAMLELAKSKCDATLHAQSRNVGIELQHLDIADIQNVHMHFDSFFDGLVSTLVLEHIQIDTYFNVLAKVLKLGSYALVTNMHADMGSRSQAGYRTPSGKRFKAVSYVYTVDEAVAAAEKAGFELVEPVREMVADERMIDGGSICGVGIVKGHVDERARKWVETKIWYGMLLKKM